MSGLVYDEAFAKIGHGEDLAEPIICLILRAKSCGFCRALCGEKTAYQRRIEDLPSVEITIMDRNATDGLLFVY